MKLSPGQVLFGASVTMVIAAVGTGLFVLGSPTEERARRIDDRRVADLQGIVAATDLYWTRHSRLPEALDDLAAEPGVRIATSDPASSEIYGYQPLDSAKYEVCASFEQESGGIASDPAGIPPIVQQSCDMCHRAASVTPNQSGEPAAGHVQLRNLWAHRSGRQCFQLEAQEITRDGG